MPDPVSEQSPTSDVHRWWRRAAIYQVYPRSFADGNGDGIGDLAGVRAHLTYLHDLGIDAIWFSPWYPSPMADAGYDVADYRDIDPAFGTLAEAEKLIAEAHGLGIRIITDIVPNHCSDQHPWFVEALASPPGSAARELFWFRDGRGDDGELPPNGWQSIFGGPAWTRVPDGQWYLHLFAPEQPDLNWDHPKVREEFEEILRFWFDRGVDGVRVDSAALCVKDPLLSELEPGVEESGAGHPYADRDGIHDIYRSWRRIADSYPDQRALIGEIWLPDTERFIRYLRPDEMHTAFNFDFLACPWDAATMRTSIDATLAAHAPVDAPATWVLANHDVTRHVTRYGREDTSFENEPVFRRQHHGVPTDIVLGTRRARAAALLTLGLPGSVYVYQGDELGLDEVEDIPDEQRQDPMFPRSGGDNPGRDGCRVPLPWFGQEPPFGFSPPGAVAQPWLPQPGHWSHLTVGAQTADPGSMLNLYRSALGLRRDIPDLPLTWLEAPDGVLAFARGAFVCVTNINGPAVSLPGDAEILLASGPLTEGGVPADTAVWLRAENLQRFGDGE